jgi:CRP-like cAMP-binding protein
MSLDSDELPRQISVRHPGELLLDASNQGDVSVVRSGWAARYVLFPDGRRQITDVVLPGEFIGCNHIAAPDDAISAVALSDVEACMFAADVFISNIVPNAAHLLALLKVCGAQAIRLRNLLAAMGRQSGTSRIAAFLLSLHKRLVAIGEANESQMPYHLRQQDLADILGMTQVHVSRTMRSLHDAHIISVQGKSASILDHAKLNRLARA